MARPDTLAHPLTARPTPRSCPGRRSRLADHVDLLPRLNELLVKLLAGLVEAAEALARVGEAVVAAAGELRDRGSDDDVRRGVRAVKRLLEQIEYISRKTS